MDRRNFLKVASAAGALAAAGAEAGSAFAANAPKSDAKEVAKLNKLFEDMFQAMLDESSEGATSLGLDVGPRAAQRAKLDDRSIAADKRGYDLARRFVKELNGVDRKKLQGLDGINYDSVKWSTETGLEGERFPTGGNPYVISQLTGSYQSLPDFMASQHPIETKADVDAYLARLEQFPRVLDQETERARADAARGVTPPDFVLYKTITQLTALRSMQGDKSVLVSSLAERTKAAKLEGDFAAKAEAIVDGPIANALDRQLAFVIGLKDKAVHDAGVWRLPDGEALYAYGLKNGTTTSMTPDEVHKLGLEKVAEITSQIDAIFKAQGMTQGTPAERLSAIGKDPKFLYANTDEAKEKLISDLNDKIAAIQPHLSAYFGTLPKSKVQVKRVPKATEAGAPGGYYQGASLDGKRPGAYYINLRDTKENAAWGLTTLTYHEAVPGHHFQISLQQESTLPTIRKVGGFNAYVEGWALYSEELAVEMGMYKNDPFGHIGQLQAALFRAVRLVVDSGMHAKRWSREQAIKYMVTAMGDEESAVVTEIERYCVWPGQATGYMVGKLTWLRLRAKAKAALGAKFDIRKFHDVCLLGGAMPLSTLEQLVDGWILTQK